MSHGPVDAPDAPKLAGDPVAYQKPNGEHDVFYRGVDKHIHRLFWPPGNVNHEDLSSVAEAADASGIRRRSTRATTTRITCSIAARTAT